MGCPAADQDLCDTVVKVAHGYIMTVLCFCGVLGNVLMLLALTQQRAMRSSNTVHYLRILSVVDMCVLLLAFIRYRSFAIFLGDKQVEEFMFNVQPYLRVYLDPIFCGFLGVSSFVVLCLSVDRYLAIRFSLSWLKSKFSPGIVYVQTLLCIVLAFGLSCPVMFCYDLEHLVFFNNRSIVVLAITKFGLSSDYEKRLNHLIVPVVWYIIPWITMALCNTLLYRQVQKSSRFRVGLPSVAQPSRKLSILIVLVVLFHMVCNLPGCLLFFYSVAHDDDNHARHTSTKAYFVSTVISDILNTFSSCLNILVYSCMGSKFRQELRHFLLCRICSKSGSSSTSIATVQGTLPGTNGVKRRAGHPSVLDSMPQDVETVPREEGFSS